MSYSFKLMKSFYTTKIRKVGNSSGVLIPKFLLKLARFEEGNWVKLDYNGKTKAMTVRKAPKPRGA